MLSCNLQAYVIVNIAVSMYVTVVNAIFTFEINRQVQGNFLRTDVIEIRKKSVSCYVQYNVLKHIIRRMPENAQINHPKQ